MSARDKNEFEVQVTKLVRSLMSATVHALAGKGPFAFYEHLSALSFAIEEFVRLRQGKYFATYECCAA